jgi:hypothetical protein
MAFGFDPAADLRCIEQVHSSSTSYRTLEQVARGEECTREVICLSDA